MSLTWYKNHIKFILYGFILFLAWCGSSATNTSEIKINSEWFTFDYKWNIDLEKILVQNNDPSDIIDIYQEAKESTPYKDSLIIAKWFNQWNWINLFIQDNLDTLEIQWLSIENIKRKQISITKNKKTYKAVLVEYDIIKWFIDSVPKLYISQLFIDIEPSFLIYSYTTESATQRSSISKSLKDIY